MRGNNKENENGVGYPEPGHGESNCMALPSACSPKTHLTSDDFHRRVEILQLRVADLTKALGKSAHCYHQHDGHCLCVTKVQHAWANVQDTYKQLVPGMSHLEQAMYAYNRQARRERLMHRDDERQHSESKAKCLHLWERGERPLGPSDGSASEKMEKVCLRDEGDRRRANGKGRWPNGTNGALSSLARSGLSLAREPDPPPQYEG